MARQTRNWFCCPMLPTVHLVVCKTNGRCRVNHLRILVADDHEIVRHGLAALIKGHPGWVVCAESNNGSDAVAKAKELKPDVAILDIGMPVLNGFEATRQILRNNPNIKVLIL